MHIIQEGERIATAVIALDVMELAIITIEVDKGILQRGMTHLEGLDILLETKEADLQKIIQHVQGHILEIITILLDIPDQEIILQKIETIHLLVDLHLEVEVLDIPEAIAHLETVATQDLMIHTEVEVLEGTQEAVVHLEAVVIRVLEEVVAGLAVVVLEAAEAEAEDEDKYKISLT